MVLGKNNNLHYAHIVINTNFVMVLVRNNNNLHYKHTVIIRLRHSLLSIKSNRSRIKPELLSLMAVSVIPFWSVIRCWMMTSVMLSR